MNLITVIVLITLALLVAAALYFSWCGLFSRVSVDERNAGPFLLLFKKHIGEYRNIGPVMDSVYYELINVHNIKTTRGFGLYYDNPAEVEKSKLRSLAGCILDGYSEQQIKKLHPELHNNFGVATSPSTQSVTAGHPYKGTLSIILGVFKVYPSIQKWMKKYNRRSVPIMEIYDQPNRKISYLAAFDIPDSFYSELLDQAP